MTSFKSFECERCKKSFNAQVRAKSKPGPKFCSITCSSESRKGKPSKNNHQVSKVCEVCMQTYKVAKYRLISAQTCSDECRHILHGSKVLRHGKSKDKIYIVWSNMKKRCTNPNTPEWEHYGGRGISVCEQWLNSFESFYKYMGDPPEGLTIDRIDNDGNYEPGNVRWADYVTQSLNSRRWQR